VTETPERRGAFFGRRKGKRLRQRQSGLIETLLPRLRIDPRADPREAFLRPVARVWLEIGFGGGEHLCATARAHPEIGFIGCEPFVNGLAKLLAVVDAEGLDNVRLWDADATELLRGLPEACLDRVYLLYPDPWPKRRHRKRRFISEASLEALARVMPPGAELRFATDIDDYAGWALARVLRSRHFAWDAAQAREWRQPWDRCCITRYETKAVREGRRPMFLTFRRTETLDESA
jgi:tRNA (guanine-N7-)-methyltransferase